MNPNRVKSWSTIAACIALLACGDDSGKDAPEETSRATILNASAQMIAASALSAAPGQDFVVARSRVEAAVPPARVSAARGLPLGAGSAASVVGDTMLRETRSLAAKGLGTSIDPVKEADAKSAQDSIDALMSEVVKINPAAKGCSDLTEDKASACAIAFLILEVRRSEGAVVTPDAGTPTGDGSISPVVDGGSTDAGTVLPANAISCPTSRDVTDATKITSGSTITGAQTWSGKILISGSVYISNAQITINAGTQIFMDTDALLYFGYTDAVGLFANGTAAAPITICGRTATKGYWDQITIGDKVTSDSSLNNVLIAEGGGNDNALEVDASITVNNVQVVDSGKDGVIARKFKAGSVQLGVRNASGYAVVIADQAALGTFPLGGAFSGNTNNVASLTLNTIDTDLTVHNLGIPYAQQNPIYQNKGNLVIEAGVEWRLKTDVTMSFAYLDSSRVTMQGTAAAPIKFLPIDSNSQWGNFIFYDKLSSDSTLSYVQISGGARTGDNVVDLRAQLKLDHVTFDANKAGLKVSNKGLTAGSTALKISGTATRPLSVDSEGVYSIPTDSTFTGNTIDQVALTSSTFDTSGTIPNLNVPYYVTGALYDGNNISVTIAAGTQFVMAADSRISLGQYGGNTVTLAGTAAAPIKFRGEQALGAFWAGIQLGSSALSNSKVDWVEISDAGGTSTTSGSLTISNAIPVTNTKISNGTGWCIYANTSLADTYFRTLTSSNPSLACTLGGVNPKNPT